MLGRYFDHLSLDIDTRPVDHYLERAGRLDIHHDVARRNHDELNNHHHPRSNDDNPARDNDDAGR